MPAKDKLLNGIWDTLEVFEQMSTSADVDYVSNADLIKAHKLLVKSLLIIAEPIEAVRRKRETKEE